MKIFMARSVITMEPSLPRATAVLVEGDRILEVGSVESLAPWTEGRDVEIDKRFADAVICPGFIDPHLHPTMAAVLLPMNFITAMRWKLPWGDVEPTTTESGFNERMAAIADVTDVPLDEPLLFWGYHQLWHGAMSRARIDAVLGNRPAVVWHRSFHELYMNSAALELVGVSADTIRPGSQIDIEGGHFFENGLGLAISKLNRWLLAPDRYHAGLKRLRDVVHHGGHTTIGDMATGIFGFEMEWEGLKAMLDGDDTPFRTRLVADGLPLASAGKPLAEGADFVDSLPERNTHRLQFGKLIKLFADGAFFSQLAQMLPPGYIDGHDGEWLMPPDTLRAAIREYWHRGYQIHVHVTGDLGLELALDCLEEMQAEKPRFRHGFTLEHFGFSTPEQVRRAAELGAQVSANVYYLHELSDIYARHGIGWERASQTARLGSAWASGMNVALHSDFTMAPAEPLNSAWVAANRVNHTGQVMCPEEALTPEQALAAITINAARVLQMADDVGSLRAGKKADFTVLAEDPLEADPMRLRDLEILATVFEGEVCPR